MMPNDFQLSLIAAGAAAVAAVWIFNLLQERRHRKAAERIFQGEQADALLGAEAETPEPEPVAQESVEEDAPADRVEPVIGELSDDSQVSSFKDDPRPAPMVLEVDEVLAVSERPFSGPAVVDSNEPDDGLHDPVVDVGVSIRFDDPLPAVRLWQILHGLVGKVSKPLGLIARGIGGWQAVPPQDDGSYQEFRGLLQLADRQGPLTEAELDLYVTSLEQVVSERGGMLFHFPQADVIHHAQALDEFCASVDIQVAVHVVNNNGIPGSKLRGLLEATGFQWRPDGLFHQVDEAGQSRITVANFDGAALVKDDIAGMTLLGVTFGLDVPRVADGPRVFDQLLATARRLAEAVDGTLVNDQRQPLADPVLATIRVKIAETQQQMADNQLPAGGRRALRLFV